MLPLQPSMRKARSIRNGLRVRMSANPLRMPALLPLRVAETSTMTPKAAMKSTSIALTVLQRLLVAANVAQVAVVGLAVVVAVAAVAVRVDRAADADRAVV